MVIETKKLLVGTLKPNESFNSKAILSKEIVEMEWLKCQMSLLYYLSNYVLIQDSISQTITKWQPWSHLVELVTMVQEWADQPIPRKPCYILIIKSRQVGASTTVSGIANWLAEFFQSSRVIMLSQKEDTAAELVNRCRFINRQQPDYLRLKLDPDQTSLLGFPATNSRIRALPSTENAGRITDATMVVTDEWETHQEASKIFASVKPAMDRGGIFIGVTTVDKTNMDSLPKEIWRGARAGDNNFKTLFWGYFVVPGRTEETYENDTKGLAEWQKEGEYPRTEAEALAVPKSTCYFNRDSIDQMFADCVEPVEVRYGGIVRIYKKSVANKKYVFAIDTSEGEYDPMAGVIADWQTGEDVVAVHGKVSIDQQARICSELYEEYNKPLIAVERNATGTLIIEKLLQMGVTNWFYSDSAKKKPGWWTSHVSRPVMLAEHAERLSERQIRIPMRDALSEHLSFSWIEGKPQAVRGSHDDWIMAHAILGQLMKRMPVGNIKITSFKYKESR